MRCTFSKLSKCRHVWLLALQQQNILWYLNHNLIGNADFNAATLFFNFLDIFPKIPNSTIMATYIVFQIVVDYIEYMFQIGQF